MRTQTDVKKNEISLKAFSVQNRNFVQLFHSSQSSNITFCPFQVQPTIFLLIPGSFRLISIYSGSIIVHSVAFWWHYALFQCLSASFRSLALQAVISFGMLTIAILLQEALYRNNSQMASVIHYCMILNVFFSKVGNSFFFPDL